MGVTVVIFKACYIPRLMHGDIARNKMDVSNFPKDNVTNADVDLHLDEIFTVEMQSQNRIINNRISRA